MDGGREGVAHKVLVDDFWRAEDRELAVKQVASQYMEPFHKDIKGWDKRNQTVTMGGYKVKVSNGERIAIYLDSLNPQNERHQLGGGYILRSNPNKEFKPTVAERDAIVSGVMDDPRMLEVAQTIQDGYQNVLRPALNETSVKVLGYELATIDNYHPMVTKRGFMDTDNDTIHPNSMKAFNEYFIDSSGHFKERTVGASNPIMLQDAIAKYDQMVSLVAKYHGYAEPLRDAKAFLNSKTTDGTSTRQTIEETVGTRYNDMADAYLKDLEQGYEKSTRGLVRTVNAKVNKATNKVVRGILGHNLKVASLQPISYEMSLNVIPPKYHAIGRVSVPASWEEMGRHSPFLWDRGKGHLSIAFGESTREKSANRGMQMIRYMDRQAVGRIWRASEAWVKDDLGYIDYKEVARRANDAVRRTQPTFSMIDRPAIARNNQFLYRSLSMFSSQRTKDHTLKLKNDIGMLGKLQRGDATNKDWAEWGAKSMLNRVWGPGLVALNGALWGMLFSKKYEDDERSFVNRYANSYVDVSIGEIGPVASALAGETKYLVSKLSDDVEGRQVSSALLKSFEYAVNDLAAFAKTLQQDEDAIMTTEDQDEINKKRMEALEDLIKSGMTISGRGEYHYWDYVQHVREWMKEPDYSKMFEEYRFCINNSMEAYNG
jgi:hypothetical protein